MNRLNPTIRSRTGWYRPVVVQCSGTRCLAYRDPRRKLRSFWTDRLLTGVIQVLDRED